MPFRIFRVRTVAGANVAGLLLGVALFANFFILTLYVQQVLGWSALKTGVTFIATAGTAILWAGVAQALVTRVGVKLVMAVGFVAMIAGMLWYTQIPVHASYWSDLLPGYLLVGFALPFAFIPVSIAALAGVEHDEAGLASGLINTAQQIGGAIGVAVTSSVSLSHFNHLVKTGVVVPGGVHDGLAVGVLGHGRRQRRRPRRDARCSCATPSSRARPRGGGRPRSGSGTRGRLPPPMAREYPTVLDLVGHTPIVRLDRISEDVPGRSSRSSSS